MSSAALQRGAERSSSRRITFAITSWRGDDLRVRVAHHVDGRVDQRGRDEVARAEQVRVTHRAPDDAAQHVAALLVRRPHAVGDDERHRARVLGEDAQRDVGSVSGVAVRDAGDLLGRGDQRPEHVDVPDRRRRPAATIRLRSSPAPVSMLGFGSGTARAVGRWSYCMNTRFQISM